MNVGISGPSTPLSSHSFPDTRREPSAASLSASEAPPTPTVSAANLNVQARQALTQANARVSDSTFGRFKSLFAGKSAPTSMHNLAADIEAAKTPPRSQAALPTSGESIRAVAPVFVEQFRSQQSLSDPVPPLQEDAPEVEPEGWELAETPLDADQDMAQAVTALAARIGALDDGHSMTSTKTKTVVARLSAYAGVVGSASIGGKMDLGSVTAPVAVGVGDHFVGTPSGDKAKTKEGAPHVSYGVRGHMETQQAFRTERKGDAFVVTITDTDGWSKGWDHGKGLGAEGSGEDVTNRGTVKTYQLVCDSPESAARAIESYRRTGDLDVPGTQVTASDAEGRLVSLHMVDTQYLAKKADATNHGFTLNPAKLAHRVTGRELRHKTEVDYTLHTFSTGGRDHEVETFACSTSKNPTSAALGALCKVTKAVAFVGKHTVGVGATLDASRVGHRAELRLERATVVETGERSVSGHIEVQLDSSQIKALQENPEALGIIVDQQVGHIVQTMQRANSQHAGTIEVDEPAVRQAVTQAVLAIAWMDQSAVQGKDIEHMKAELSGKIGFGKVAELSAHVFAAATFGQILTMRLPLAETEPTQAQAHLSLDAPPPPLAIDVQNMTLGVTDKRGISVGGGVAGQIGPAVDAGPVKVGLGVNGGVSGEVGGSDIRTMHLVNVQAVLPQGWEVVDDSALMSGPAEHHVQPDADDEGLAGWDVVNDPQ